jgi:hypothetical protein
MRTALRTQGETFGGRFGIAVGPASDAPPLGRICGALDGVGEVTPSAQAPMPNSRTNHARFIRDSVGDEKGERDEKSITGTSRPPPPMDA